MFTEVQTTRTYEKIIEQIKENIKNNKLKKGDRLPPERLMAEQMGISRLTVREALSYLLAIGLIENKAGNGNYIKSDLSSMLYEPMSMYILLEDIDFQEVLSLRKTLQTQCIAICTDNITVDNLNELETICDKMKICENYDKLIELDLAFHSYIVKGTNKKLVNIIYNSISELVMDYISHAWTIIYEDKDKLKKTINLHVDIFNAIKNKDKLGAIDAMQKHFEFIEKYIDPLLK